MYKGTCKCNPSQYIGQTKRRAVERFREHRYSIYPSSDKTIGQHFSSSGHKIADLQIIPFEQIRSKNPWIRLSREKFYIRKLEPRLNRIV